MPNFTTVLDLIKPLGNENFSVQHANGNADKIDAAVGDVIAQLEQVISEIKDLSINVNNYKKIIPETDDTGRIQRALNDAYAENNVALFPANTSYVANNIVLNQSQKIKLLGEITLTEGTSGHIFKANNIQDVVIFGEYSGRLVGNELNGSSAIQLNNVNGFLISGLVINGFLNKGIDITGESLDGMVINNKITGSSGPSGVAISLFSVNAKNTIISQNICNNNRMGIAINGGQMHSVITNQCHDNNLCGITFDGVITGSGDGVKNSVISNNIVSGCKTTDYGGIYIGNGSKFNTISNNQSNKNARSGIRLSGGTNFEPSDNKFQNNITNDNEYSGIEASYALRSDFIGNTSENNKKKGIHVLNSDGSVFSLNKTRNNLEQGLLIQSGSCQLFKNLSKGNDKGIELAFGGTSPNNNIIESNDCQNNVTSQIVNAGTNVYRNNIGYVSENKGRFITNSDGSQKVFTILHGLNNTPTNVSVVPTNATSMGNYFVGVNASNIIVTYQDAPTSATNGINLFWKASL